MDICVVYFSGTISQKQPFRLSISELKKDIPVGMSLILSPENKKLAGVEGIEPSSMVLETTVLPLYYTPSKLTFYPIANKPESKELKQ